ncbi:hypothetical protein BCR44DRAFT_1506910 [Catenaria anguillulae PL171]|uniref:NAD-dependent epimerase/dehydratase domain-containing protein n=1 Tax=Catenaria anguillulae PL171 TaxID=765915 RepID=A0A1Y2H5L6_9FUNG|nr:hypothetical protein BCR44DRAFT_1506910 [Catenaria anguillulae PL171]
MRVLITGGAGLIGSHLARALLLPNSSSVHVTVLDNLSSAAYTHLPTLVVHLAVPEPLPGGTCDAGCRADMLGGMHQVLASMGNARMVLVSSADVYGNLNVNVRVPDANPQHRRRPVHATQSGNHVCETLLAMESLVVAHARTHARAHWVLRVWPMYGAWPVPEPTTQVCSKAAVLRGAEAAGDDEQVEDEQEGWRVCCECHGRRNGCAAGVPANLNKAKRVLGYVPTFSFEPMPADPPTWQAHPSQWWWQGIKYPRVSIIPYQSQYRQLAENLLASLSTFGQTRNYFLFAIDPAAARDCLHWNSKDMWAQVSWVKPRLVRALLELGFEVHLSDTDISYVRDVWASYTEYLDEVGAQVGLMREFGDYVANTAITLFGRPRPQSARGQNTLPLVMPIQPSRTNRLLLTGQLDLAHGRILLFTSDMCRARPPFPSRGRHTRLF